MSNTGGFTATLPMRGPDNLKWSQDQGETQHLKIVFGHFNSMTYPHAGGEATGNTGGFTATPPMRGPNNQQFV